MTGLLSTDLIRDLIVILLTLHLPRHISLILKIISFSILTCIATVANAVVFTVPPTSTGTFTITWSGAGDFGNLWESRTTGDTQVASTTASGSYTTTKTAGTYSYYLQYRYQSSPLSGNTTPRQSVVVSTPPPPVTIPAIPTKISAIANVSSMVASWTYSAGATSYQLKRNGSLIYTGANNGYADTGAMNGTSYIYSVSACNSAGCSGSIASAAKVAGVVAAGSSVAQGYEYDTLGRLERVKVNGALKTDYRYDKAGNRKTATEQ
jgi:hypothetical protein